MRSCVTSTRFYMSLTRRGTFCVTSTRFSQAGRVTSTRFSVLITTTDQEVVCHFDTIIILGIPFDMCHFDTRFLFWISPCHDLLSVTSTQFFVLNFTIFHNSPSVTSTRFLFWFHLFMVHLIIHSDPCHFDTIFCFDFTADPRRVTSTRFLFWFHLFIP